jgi:hypothetical protein
MTDSLFEAVENQIKRAQSNIYTALPAKVITNWNRVLPIIRLKISKN